jgi:RNA polymerase sigma factor (sigma-70 family)
VRKRPKRDDEVRNQQLWTLIHSHHNAIVSRLAFRSGNRDLAEDLAHEMWERVGCDVSSFFDDPNPLPSLMKVAHRVADTNSRRQRRRGEQQPGPDAITGLADNALAERLLRGVRRLRADRDVRDSRAVPYAGNDSHVDPMRYADLRMDMGAAVAQLTERQQEALYLYYRHDLSPNTIALHMDISRQAVERLLDKALKTLRKSPRLAGWNEEEVGR